MKLIILVLILSIFVFTPHISAQTHTISGIVKDFQKSVPLQGVTIALYSKSNQKLLGGTSSNEKGVFNLKYNFKEKNILIRLSYIGYETKQIDTINFLNNKANLGTILLKPSSIMKSAVEITGQKPMVEFYVDKQVINMDQVPGSQSGSVSEALRNTGIVEVDPTSSKISLRGNSNVNILIDGKPQPMADNLLSQMPASYIDKVEVITTPSAKDDPEGDAGIINIITKKEHHDNYNGTFAFYSATQQIGYLSSALNYKKGSINIFGSANGYWGKFTKYTDGERINYLSDILHSQNSVGQTLTQGYMSNIKLGLDYDFDTLNSLSLTGNYNKTNGKMIISADNFIYNLSGAETYSYFTTNNGHGDFNNYNVSADYKNKFNSKGHEITADAFYSTIVNSTHGLLTTQYNYLPLYPGLQNNNNDVNNKTLILNTDYVNPTETVGKIEAGYKLTFRDRKATLANLNYSYLSGMYYDSLKLSNVFRYRENIHALYLSYTNNISVIEYKLGLRDEQTFTDGLQEVTGEEFKTDYNSLFPTFGLSYKMNEIFQLSLNAARKINRPQLEMINPFIKVNGPNSITIGNPKLAPTYTNSFEFKFNPILDVYYNDSKGSPSSVSTNINDSITVNTTINSTSNKSYGFELTIPIINNPKFPLKLPDWFGMFNVRIAYNRLIENGGYLTEIYSIKRDSWKFSGNCNLNLWWDINVIFYYNIALKTNDDRYITNASPFAGIFIKKEFMDKKLTIGLNINDVFNAMRPVNETYGSNFYSYSKSSSWRSRNIGLSVKYNFNDFTKHEEKEVDDGRDKDEGLFK